MPRGAESIAGYSSGMRYGTGKMIGALALALAAIAAVVPAAGVASPGADASIERGHWTGASASASITFLTINGLSGVENRINVFVAPTGRLTVIAPEGLTDPDGEAGQNCTLDNAPPGQAMATQISCVGGYAQAIVGDLGGGNDSFIASPDLPVQIGGVLNGQRRPLSGGIGDDRIVSGVLGDLLDGGIGKDVLIGNGGEDLLAGGGGRDKLSGGAARDALYGGGGRDRLNGGKARDLCHGGAGRDSRRRCEILQAIP
jgi:Ca2+-binding RTX toxin-like protein